MEAFSNMGNHLVSNSAAAINASDDISTIDPDESVLSLAKGPRRRRHDDEESEGLDEDDMESLASAQVNGQAQPIKPEEEKELPPHACAYVLCFKPSISWTYNADTTPIATVESIIQPVSFDVYHAASGSAVPVGIRRPLTSLITSSVPGTRRFSFTLAALWATRSWNATTVVPKMCFCLASYLPNPTRLWFCYVANHVRPCHLRKT